MSPHGSKARYRRGCSCRVCREAHSERCRRYAARRRRRNDYRCGCGERQPEMFPPRTVSQCRVCRQVRKRHGAWPAEFRQERLVRRWERRATLVGSLVGWVPGRDDAEPLPIYEVPIA